jgi:hypothetical protein
MNKNASINNMIRYQFRKILMKFAKGINEKYDLNLSKKQLLKIHSHPNFEKYIINYLNNIDE